MTKDGILYRREQCYKLVYITLKKSITLPTLAARTLNAERFLTKNSEVKAAPH